ncbi:MAG: LPD28 domain-containing protein [Psychrobacillus sp.]
MKTQKGMFNLRGVPVILTSIMRIPQREREEGLHYYDVRHSDEDYCAPASVERLVRVNHLCTIATSKPLLPEGISCLELSDKESERLIKVI